MVETSNEGNNKTDSGLQTLTPALQESIKKIIEKEKYIKYNATLREFDTHGDNFLGKLYEIDIIGDTAKSIKETNIFVKQPVDIKKFKLVSVANSYINEVFVYNDLSKVFTSLQNQANVPQEDRYRIVQAYDETDTNGLILENLSKRGFTTIKKTETISIKYAELAVQELAKFHALTFVIEHRMPEYYNNKIKVLKCAFNFDEDWEAMIRNICAHVVRLYDGDEKRKKVEKLLPIIIEKLPKYYSEQTTVRCTLTHGDYKKNNMLVRLKDGEPVEIVPVDYQLMDYGSPIRDLLFFIFSGTDREFRRKHLNYVKEFYFETLSRFLKYFGMDVETVYPREEFEKVYTEWLDYGLMMTVFASLVMFAPDTGLDLVNLTLTELPYCPDKAYDHIFRGLIDDFIDWGYL